MKEINVTVPDSRQRDLMVDICGILVESDEEFHVFPEGEYLQIRCKEESVNRVLDHINRHASGYGVMKVDVTGNYMDPNPDVSKYQKQFEQIFHAETIMAYKLMMEENVTGECTGEEAKRLYERIIHLAYITMEYPIRRLHIREYKKDWVEPMTLAHMLVCRGMYNGMLEYYGKQVQLHNENKEE
jgi:hypothetical protein